MLISPSPVTAVAAVPIETHVWDSSFPRSCVSTSAPSLFKSGLAHALAGGLPCAAATATSAICPTLLHFIYLLLTSSPQHHPHIYLASLLSASRRGTVQIFIAIPITLNNKHQHVLPKPLTLRRHVCTRRPSAATSLRQDHHPLRLCLVSSPRHRARR